MPLTGTERVKSGKESKYAIISVLANSGDILTLAPQETLVQMKQFVKDGAFFVEAQPEVAYEGEN